MSHEGKHTWGPWSTETIINAAGEKQTVLMRYCQWPRCGASDEERGAVIEPKDVGEFRHIQQVGEEPSD